VAILVVAILKALKTQTTRVYYIPVKLFRELIIINYKLKDTTPPEIIRKVNEVTPLRKGAVAVKILLKSGDVIITFKEEV